jgi:hypothetical protein
VKRPRDRNSPINQARKDAWVREFAGYRSAVNQGRIEAWLSLFEHRDQDLAARVLDAVDFYDQERIANSYRAVLKSLPGWDIAEAKRKGKWRFAAMSETPGDSGGTMLHQFRVANGMANKKYNELFVYPSTLIEQRLGADDCIVLLNDFVGTGIQVETAWEEAYSELVAGVGTVYLVVIAACQRGREHVQKTTDLTVVFAHELTEADNLFSNECGHFTNEEKETFRKYCKRARSKEPDGFGNCGLVLVFAHRCPNNTVPALHATHRKWHGLFPRHDSMS